MMASFITEKGTRTVRHPESKITFSVNLAKFSTPSHKGGFLFFEHTDNCWRGFNACRILAYQKHYAIPEENISITFQVYSGRVYASISWNPPSGKSTN